MYPQYNSNMIIKKLKKESTLKHKMDFSTVWIVNKPPMLMQEQAFS
jgi:hypothetical protein